MLGIIEGRRKSVRARGRGRGRGAGLERAGAAVPAAAAALRGAPRARCARGRAA